MTCPTHRNSKIFKKGGPQIGYEKTLLIFSFLFCTLFKKTYKNTSAELKGKNNNLLIKKTGLEPVEQYKQ